MYNEVPVPVSLKGESHVLALRSRHVYLLHRPLDPLGNKMTRAVRVLA